MKDMKVEIVCMACSAHGEAPLSAVASIRCRCGAKDFDLLDSINDHLDPILDSINDHLDPILDSINDYLDRAFAAASDVCPQCGSKIEPTQTVCDDGKTLLLKAKCSCGWKGKKYRPMGSKTAAASKMKISFKAIEGDPWAYLGSLVGTPSTDWMEPQGDNVWVAVIKIPLEQVGKVMDLVKQGRLISAEMVDDIAVAASLRTAAPVMVELNSGMHKKMRDMGYIDGREDTWDSGIRYVYLIPPDGDSDQADAMFENKRAPNRNEEVVYEHAPDYIPDWMSEYAGPVYSSIRVAAWGIFKRKDDTPVYGPVPKEAVDIAMHSGRYGENEFYAGTMADPPQRLETGGDPFRDVGDSDITPSYQAKVSEIEAGLVQTNPGLPPATAHRLALRAVQRYPGVVG